jgi:DNA-binding transcriptional LysR family regulator
MESGPIHAMRLEAIDTHLIVALHALLQERSVTRAARRIGITQPSMSHALARLRSHFGDPLLVQVGRSMTLSAAARGLVDKAGTAVVALEHVFAPVAPFDPQTTQRAFHLFASDNLELLVLPRVARIIARRAPFIDVRCRNIPPDWSERLVRGDADGKLGRGGPVPKGCRSTTLTEETFVCLLRRGHPATRRPLTAKRYAACDHLVVAPHGGDTSPIDRALSERGLRRRVAMTVSHFLVAPFIVAGSDLVLTVSARVAAATAKRLDLVQRPCPVAPASYPLTFVWPTRLEHDEGHRWFRETIAASID